MVTADPTPVPRWFTRTSDGHSQWYVERFRTMAAEGADLAGEARLVDAMVPPGSRLLDAGCGPGRVAAALHDRGHRVVGVDVDPVLIAAAIQDHPGPQWVVGDLSTFDLGTGEPDFEPFDLALLAGNVMVFVAPDTEHQVLRRVAAHVRSGGRIDEVGLGSGSGTVDFFAVLGKEATITGSYAWGDADFTRAIDLVSQDVLDVNGWLTTMALADGHRAFEELVGGAGHFKVVLVP